MASTFKTLIEEFVGETENDNALSSYLTHTAREVQDALDKEEKLSVSIRIQMEGNSYNITDKKILQVMKQDASTGEYVMAQKADVSKIGTLGWKATVPIEEGLKKCFCFYGDTND